MKRLWSKNGKWIGVIIAFCLATLILLWKNYFDHRDRDKQNTIASAIQRNTNLAVALEQYAIRTIQNADVVLQLVKMEYDRKKDSIQIKKLFYSNPYNRQIFKGVLVINEKGKLLDSDDPFTFGTDLNFSDREYFRFHKQANDNRLFISKPVLSKFLDVPVIVISRRINHNDGSFGGVVAIYFEPYTFTSFYAQANVRQHDILSLISPDGITYARRTGAVESSGEDISKSPLFRHLRSNPDSFYAAPDAIHGIPTYFSYRKLRDYPMIATVGASEQDVLGGYRDRVTRDLISTIVMSALLVLFTTMVSLILLHRRKMADKLMAEEARYQRAVTEQVIWAQEKEREEIGHELHDNVNQVLTTVKLYLEMALHQPEARQQLIEKSIKLVMKSIGEIRNLSHDLSAPTLGTRSLVDSINALIEMMSSASRLKIFFDHSGYQTKIAMNEKLALYRIIQEQLNNVVKHARADKVWITMSQTESDTRLVIRDNGKGFDPGQKRNGIGINNMINRAKVLNGKVEIESAPGKGCTLTVILPTLVNDDGIHAPVELVQK